VVTNIDHHSTENYGVPTLVYYSSENLVWLLSILLYLLEKYWCENYKLPPYRKYLVRKLLIITT